MTDDLRARIAEALRQHDANMDGGNPAHEADEAYGCCADAVMTVLATGLAERGTALRRLMCAAEKLELDWPNPGRPEHRQAVTRAVNEVERLFIDVIRAWPTTRPEYRAEHDAALNEVSRLGEEIGD